MYCLLRATRSLCDRRCTACPWNQNSPVQALSSIPMMLSSVDFPAPEGPMIDTNSPGRTSYVMRRSTKVCDDPAWNDFSTFRIEMSVAPTRSPLGASGVGIGAGSAREPEKKDFRELMNASGSGKREAERERARAVRRRILTDRRLPLAASRFPCASTPPSARSSGRRAWRAGRGASWPGNRSRLTRE